MIADSLPSPMGPQCIIVYAFDEVDSARQLVSGMATQPWGWIFFSLNASLYMRRGIGRWLFHVSLIVLELMAAWEALKTFSRLLQGKWVKWMLGNKTGVYKANLNSMESIPSYGPVLMQMLKLHCISIYTHMPVCHIFLNVTLLRFGKYSVCR